jgi:hypothetical protein
MNMRLADSALTLGAHQRGAGASANCLAQSVENVTIVHQRRSLFLHHFLVKLANQAVGQLRGKRALHLPAAECAGDDPATTASIGPAIESIRSLFDCRRAYSQLASLESAGFTPALLELPTTLLHSPSSIRAFIDESIIVTSGGHL